MPDKINKKKLAQDYGFALAFMQSDPELAKLFNQAVKNTWAPEKFIAQLRDTKWFKANSANVRNAILQETGDPATYQANVAQMAATVKQTWTKLFGTADMDDSQLNAWAETAHRMGWSEAQLVAQMTKGLDYQKLLVKKDLGGTAAEAAQQIDQLISSYGIDLGSQWKAAQIEKIVEGNDTLGGVQNRLRDLAKQEYGAFSAQIDAGQTIAEIADPYRQKMADLLELNPNDVTLKDSMIQKALKQRAQDGRPAALTLTDFADEVRKDQRWQYTDNAREQVSNLTQSLLSSFGLAQ